MATRVSNPKSPDRRMDQDRPKATPALPGAPHPSCAGTPSRLPSSSDGSCRQAGVVPPDAAAPRRQRNIDMQRAIATGDRSAEAYAWLLRQARQKRMKRRALRERRASLATAARQAITADREARQSGRRPVNPPTPPRTRKTLLNSAAKAWQRLWLWVRASVTGGRHG